MRQITILFFLVTIFHHAYSQDENLQFKLDSIIAEADLMYKYEKAVWNSSDLLMADKKLKKIYGGYVVRHSGDSIFVTFLNKKQNERIARYIYMAENFNKPNMVSLELSPLSVVEKELIDIKNKMVDQLSNSEYNITIPKGFDPNFVLIRENTQFKLYILMGTRESGVIPFGNDFLFRAASDGIITNWQRFHSRLIPTYVKGPDGGKVISSTHSHLKTTPYITATDICTFRLYGELCDMEEFSVYANGKYFKYHLKTNKIEIEEI